ncbi:hypothetical protein BCR35DRAFT_330126 [Leucosporidium creatinivorum]|uniref:Stress response RCI peptide n=1 Tax=Leucosporidium creatinivorum TaxID=106004 RepID=A0A1Y2FXI5_9BASI|nr:hypothetical protein BCR35DRAFT_330126 [Leucosporidium creatinivorum]
MADSASSSRPTGRDVALGILAVVLPFAAVGLKRGVLTTHFWLCFFLTCFGYFPGVIHASYIVWSKEPKKEQPSVVVVHQCQHGAAPADAEALPPAYLQRDLEAAHGYRELNKRPEQLQNPFTEAEIHGNEVRVAEKGERFGAGGRGQHVEV